MELFWKHANKQINADENIMKTEVIRYYLKVLFVYGGGDPPPQKKKRERMNQNSLSWVLR